MCFANNKKIINIVSKYMIRSRDIKKKKEKKKENRIK